LPKGLFLFLYPVFPYWGIIVSLTEQRMRDC